MLDKSIPYYHVLMVRKKGTLVKIINCRKGLSLFYLKAVMKKNGQKSKRL